MFKKGKEVVPIPFGKLTRPVKILIFFVLSFCIMGLLIIGIVAAMYVNVPHGLPHSSSNATKTGSSIPRATVVITNPKTHEQEKRFYIPPSNVLSKLHPSTTEVDDMMMVTPSIVPVSRETTSTTLATVMERSSIVSTSTATGGEYAISSNCNGEQHFSPTGRATDTIVNKKGGRGGRAGKIGGNGGGGSSSAASKSVRTSRRALESALLIVTAWFAL